MFPFFSIKDIHREHAPSNKTKVLTRFVRGSYTEINFQKNKVVIGKIPFSVVGLFYTFMGLF